MSGECYDKCDATPARTLACHIVNNNSTQTGGECCWDLFGIVEKRMEGKTGSMSDLQDELNKIKEELDKLQTGTGNTGTGGGEESVSQVVAFPMNWGDIDNSVFTAPEKGSVEALRFTEQPIFGNGGGSIPSNCQLGDTNIRIRKFSSVGNEQMYVTKSPQAATSWFSFHMDMEKGDGMVIQYASEVICDDAPSINSARSESESSSGGKTVYPFGMNCSECREQVIDITPYADGARIDKPLIYVEIKFVTATYVTNTSTPKPRATLDVGNVR